MLVIRRKPLESVALKMDVDGVETGIILYVLEYDRSRNVIRLGFEAPDEVHIVRTEHLSMEEQIVIERTLREANSNH